MGVAQPLPRRRPTRDRQQYRRARNPPDRDRPQLCKAQDYAKFAGHQLGAENWAAIASLVETCKMLDIEPYAYLSDTLARIITRSDTDPIDDLLPYNWVDTNAGQTVFEMSNIASAA